MVKISRVATFAIFLALIRSISEVFRLQYYAPAPLTFPVLKPFLIAALLCAVALLCMTVLSYYNKHKLITALAVLTVILMLVIKKMFLL